MVHTHAITEEKLRQLTIEKKSRFKKLDLICHDTDMIFVPNQNWSDVGYFTPPIKAVYIDIDPSLPMNFSVRRRDGLTYRATVYAIVDKEVATRHGINLFV